MNPVVIESPKLENRAVEFFLLQVWQLSLLLNYSLMYKRSYSIFFIIEAVYHS